MSTRMYVPVLPAPSLQDTDAWTRGTGSGDWSWPAGPSLVAPTPLHPPPCPPPPAPSVPAVHNNRAGATPVALVHLPARTQRKQVSAMLGTRLCWVPLAVPRWGGGGQRAHHDVALGGPAHGSSCLPSGARHGTGTMGGKGPGEEPGSSGAQPREGSSGGTPEGAALVRWGAKLGAGCRQGSRHAPCSRHGCQRSLL